MPQPITRDTVRGSLNSSMQTLRDEAQNHIRCPEYLAQAADIIGAERMGQVHAAVERLASMRLGGLELAAVYDADIDARARLAKVEQSPETCAARWEAIGSVLGRSPPAEAAGEKEYGEATDEIVTHQNALAVLASVKIQSAAELQLKQLPPPRWTIEGLLPEGIAMLSAPPKAGKSWLSLGLAVDVASGSPALGRLPVVRGRALYLGLEDSDRRMQSRLERLGGRFPSALEIVTEIPRGVALPALLGAWLNENRDATFIILDTLGRSLRGADLLDYGDVTAALDPIQRLAFRHGVSILVINHTRKGMSEGDVFDSSLGSQGTFGAMDAAFVLQRKRGEFTAVLHATGREIGDACYSLELNPATMQWRMTDNPPEETMQGPERRAILAMLRKAEEPMGTNDIARALGRAKSTASEHLKKLEGEGLIAKNQAGKWSPVSESTEPNEQPNAGRAAEPLTPGVRSFGLFGDFQSSPPPDACIPTEATETISTAEGLKEGEVGDLLGDLVTQLRDQAVIDKLLSSPTATASATDYLARILSSPALRDPGV